MTEGLANLWPETAVIIDAILESGGTIRLLDEEWVTTTVRAWRNQTFSRWAILYRYHRDNTSEWTPCTLPDDCHECQKSMWRELTPECSNWPFVPCKPQRRWLPPTIEQPWAHRPRGPQPRYRFEHGAIWTAL